MATKVFLTGVTGYIGGDAFYLLQQSQHKLEFALLVRSADSAARVAAPYPSARIVRGDLDNSALLEKEAAWADIVIHTADASDHLGAAKAIAQGLIDGHTPERPGYWLHTGGTGILTYFDAEAQSFGEPSDKVFDDYDGVDELVNLPAAAFHRNVDEVVLDTAEKHGDKVKTAIVSPPTIYGQGRGPVSGRGRQVYVLASTILEEQCCPRIGRGLSRWNNVHVADLSRVFELLVGKAVARGANDDRDDDAGLWGRHGYYFTEHGEHVWGELSVAIGDEVRKQGYVAAAAGALPVRAMSFDEAKASPAGFEAASWGMNSRGRAVRARKLLGWEPVENSLLEEIPAIVKSEAKRLGK